MRLVRYKDLPDSDDVGGSIPTEVDAFGYEPPEIVFTIPRRRGDAIGPGRAVKRADHVAGHIVDLDHLSARADWLKPYHHLRRHDARVHRQTRLTFDHGL